MMNMERSMRLDLKAFHVFFDNIAWTNAMDKWTYRLDETCQLLHQGVRLTWNTDESPK